MKNIIYYRDIKQIGGIESFLFHIAKKYHAYDITIYFESCDPAQYERLSKYVRCKRYNGEHIKCEKAIFNYALDIIDNVEADEYIQVIHCDFVEAKKSGYPDPNINPKINRYIAVSKTVADSFKQLTGIDADVCYNPISLDKPKKVLNLISATRLSPEKGKDRMIKLATLLDNAGVPYTWTIFTNDTNAIKNNNIIYRKPRLDVVDYIAAADYLVQLSDTEGYSYSIIEALSVGTPVIVTPLPVLAEMGVNKKNSFVLDFDLKYVPIEAIYQGLPAFEYKKNNDRWGYIMAKGKSTYKKEQATIVKVKPIQEYYDLQLDKLIHITDDPFEVQKERAEYLEGLGLVVVLKEDSGEK